MLEVLPSVANTVGATLVAIADGSPITAGVANFYLIAMSGANIGKWFKTADDTWDVAEQVAATGTHKARGQWTASIDAAAWTDGVRYRLYAQESGALSIGYGYDVLCTAGVTVSTLNANALLVDGLALDVCLKALMAAGINRAVVDLAASTVAYKNRAGTATVLTLTHDGIGNRMASVLA